MTATIACLGGAVVDRIYGVAELPARDGKVPALSYAESGGGMAANAAVIVTRLGGRASWCGRLGDDDLGTRILEGLRREKIDVASARIFPGAVSSHSLVLVDRRGNRAIVIHRPEALDPDPAWLPLDSFREADAVLADNRWSEGSAVVLAAARRRGAPAVLDVDTPGGSDTMRAVASASHAVFSLPGLFDLFGTDDPVEGLRRAARHAPFVAVTMGGRGAMWLDPNGGPRTMPAFAVEAVETVGAGDVFHGAFALALAEGRAEEPALRFAAAAAALKCAGHGGRASFPDRGAVEALLMKS